MVRPLLLIFCSVFTVLMISTENGSPTGTPTNGIKIENVSMTGKNTVTVGDDAKQGMIHLLESLVEEY